MAFDEQQQQNQFDTFQVGTHMTVNNFHLLFTKWSSRTIQVKNAQQINGKRMDIKKNVFY